MLTKTQPSFVQIDINPTRGAKQPVLPWQAVIAAPFGKVGIGTTDSAVYKIAYLEKDIPEIAPQSKLAERVVAQLKQYFENPSFLFDLPLSAIGTAFQQNVWQAISAIPLGRTSTYGELAKQLGSGPRAVGQACGINPLPLIVPCHRVVLSSGGIGGFAKRVDADWQGIKRWLLMHEGAL